MGVDLPIAADRERRVSSPEGQLQEEPCSLGPGTVDVEHAGVALRDAVGVPILALDIDDVVPVNTGSVDAPLEPVRVLDHTRQRRIRLARATARLGVMALPLSLEVGVQLGDVERARRNTPGVKLVKIADCAVRLS